MLNYYTVKDITDVCNEMCADADKYDRIDISEAEKELQGSLSKLTEEYSKPVYDEVSVGKLKDQTEHDALILESVLARVSDMYKDRYLTRARIVQRFTDLQKEILEAYNKGDDELVGRLCADRFTLKDYVDYTSHCKYNLTDDDVKCLELMGVEGLCTTRV